MSILDVRLKETKKVKEQKGDVDRVRKKASKKQRTLNIEERGEKKRSIEAVTRRSAGLHCSTSAGDISSASGSQPPTTLSPSSSFSLPLVSLPFGLLVCVQIRF